MPKRRLSLDDHQPEDIEIVFKGESYDLPGAIPVPTIVRMTRIKERVADAGDDLGALGDEIKGFLESDDPSAPGIMDLIRERQPDAPLLPFSIEDIVHVINFLVESQDVEALVRESETGDDPQPEEDATPLAQAS